MSIERDDPGGKMAMERAAADAKRLVEDAEREEREAQLELLEPLTAEETAAAQEELGPLAQPLAVMRHAREKRRAGRPAGARNRRTRDMVNYLSQFGPDPAVVMMKIMADSEEAMIERSKMLDPEKRRMTYGEARALRVRCAETMQPYFHGKQPVKVDATIRGVMVKEEIGELKRARGQTIDGIAGVLPIPDDEGDE